MDEFCFKIHLSSALFYVHHLCWQKNWAACGRWVDCCGTRTAEVNFGLTTFSIGLYTLSLCVVHSTFLRAEDETHKRAITSSFLGLTIIGWDRFCVIGWYMWLQCVTKTHIYNLHQGFELTPLKKMATSWALFRGVSIQDMCSLASWASLHTFVRYF